MSIAKVIITFLLLTTTLNCQFLFPKKSKFNIDLNFNYSTSSSYFDKTSTQQYDYPDTLIVKKVNFPDDTVTRKFLYEFREYGLNIGANYKLTNRFVAGIELPISVYTLNEKYHQGDTTITDGNYQKGDYSIARFKYYGLKGQFLLDSGILTSTTDLELRIPMNFSNGIQSGTNPIQIYQAYEILAGYGVNLNLGNGWLQGKVKYNYRTGDFRDRLMEMIEAGFTTVPGTYLKAFLEASQSLASYDKAVEFYPGKTILQDDYYALGIAFNIIFNNGFYTNFSYSIRLYGKNTMNLGSFNFNTGIFL